jgi:hypothetical protein
MERLEASVHSYEQVSKKVKTLHIAPAFYTPVRHHVTLLGAKP